MAQSDRDLVWRPDRKVIRRGDFSSLEDLAAKIERFMDYFNATMARPYRWTYEGKPLAA